MSGICTGEPLASDVNTNHLRFTSYDFKKMHRRSYYPHNQQIQSQMTATSSTGFISSRPETPNLLEREYPESAHADPSLNGHDGGRPGAKGYDGHSTDAVPLHPIVSEKQFLSA